MNSPSALGFSFSAVSSSSRPFAPIVGLIVLAAFTSPLAAQHRLYLEHDGKLGLIHRVEGNYAYVLEAGKWVDYDKSGRIVLEPSAETLPVTITLHRPSFKKGAMAISDNGPSEARLIHAGRFVYNTEIEASAAVDNAVLMLDLLSEHDEPLQYLWGVGHLDPHERKRISIDSTTPFKLRGVRLKRVHVFIDGQEVTVAKVRD